MPANSRWDLIRGLKGEQFKLCRPISLSFWREEKGACSSKLDRHNVSTLNHIIHMVFARLLTALSRVLLEKLTSSQLVKEFPVIWNPKIHYSFYKSPPPAPVVSASYAALQENEEQPLAIYFSRYMCNLGSAGEHISYSCVPSLILQLCGTQGREVTENKERKKKMDGGGTSCISEWGFSRYEQFSHYKILLYCVVQFSNACAQFCLVQISISLFFLIYFSCVVR